MHLFRSRQFTILFAGYVANGIGSWAALVAIWGYAAYRFDSGPADIALLALSWAAPSALIGPLAGVPIDRLGPRRVLMWSYGAASVIAMAMALSSTFGQLFVLGLAYGVTRAFARPAADALPPRLVAEDDLLAANSLLGAADESAMVFGPLLAAAAIAVWGLRAAFVADALTYWVAIAVLLPLRLRPLEATPRAPVRQELAEGLRIAREAPVVRYTLALSVPVFLTWATFLVVEPIYVRDVLGRSATVFGLLQTAFGVGLVGTALVLPRLGERVARPRALALSVLLSGAAAALYVGTDSIVMAFVGVFLWGVDVGFFVAPARTLLQRGSPIWAHGRVLALHRTLHSWADMVALPVAGLAAAAVGVRTIGFVAAAVALVAGAVGFVRAPAPPPEEASAPDVGPEQGQGQGQLTGCWPAP